MSARDKHVSPTYVRLNGVDLTVPTRRRFLGGGAAGLIVGFVSLAPRKARAGGEEPSLKVIGGGSDETGAAFKGFAPGGFIRIAPDNTITFIIPSVEMGQGVYTGESMLIAEELDVGLDQVRVVPAPPNEKLYREPLLKSQATGGSTSIRGTWTPLRQAGAAARMMLVAAAADQWYVPPNECTTERGIIHHAASGRTLTYGAVAAAASKHSVPKDVALKSPDAFKLIGTPARRIDTPSKADGSAKYGMDVKIAGMRSAAVSICPIVGGKLKSLDDKAARAMPGVVDVVKIDNAVAVIADHFWNASEAAKALDIEWEAGDHASLASADIVNDMKSLSQQGKPVMGRTVGDVDAAYGRAKRKVEALYQLPFLAHATMEPINTVVHVRADACEIWLGTQAPASVQKTAAKVSGLPEDKVIVHNHLIGGGFGRRLVADSVEQAVAIAKQVPYPIHIIWTREQDIKHDLFRPAYYDHIAAGLGDDGLPIVFTDRVTGASVLGDYLPQGLPQGVLDSDAVEGAAETPYDFPVLRVDWVRQMVPVKVNWWRGVGPTHNVFVVESFMDELAVASGRDPVEFRRALLGKNKRALNALNRVAEMSNWGQSLPPRTAQGLSLHDSFGSYLAVVLQVNVDQDGNVKLQKIHAAMDCGIAINPDSVKAQIEGGLVFGLSAALYNGITFADGRVEQNNFNDYRQMRINEVPPIEVEVLKSGESPGGIGETGTVSAAPALGNAIYRATGVRLRELPFDRNQLRGTGGAPGSQQATRNASI